MEYKFILDQKSSGRKIPAGATTKMLKDKTWPVYHKGKRLGPVLTPHDVANFIENGFLVSDDPDIGEPMPTIDMSELKQEPSKPIQGIRKQMEIANTGKPVEQKTLRDEFAMTVLPQAYRESRENEHIIDIAKKCYSMADAMLVVRKNELDKKGKNKT